MRATLLIVLALLGGCSWFHHKKPAAPDPSQLLVTGAPEGSVVFIDGAKAADPAGSANRTQAIGVSPGEHILEVRIGDRVAYRESTYVAAGGKRVVTVLSGKNRY